MEKNLRYYVDGRLFEWAMTLPMLTLSIMTFFWPLTLRGSAFRWVITVLSAPIIETLMFAIGWTALIGLLLNGHKFRGRRLGPAIRAATAVARAVIWVQFALALLRLSILQGYPSPGVPFWMMFVIAEIYVAYRAVAGNGRTD